MSQTVFWLSSDLTVMLQDRRCQCYAVCSSLYLIQKRTCLVRPSHWFQFQACGHRWKNVYFSQKDNQNKLPHGVCFQFSSDFSHTTHYIPCYRGTCIYVPPRSCVFETLCIVWINRADSVRQLLWEDSVAKRLFVCADHQRKFGEDYGSCQAGISNFLTEVITCSTRLDTPYKLVWNSGLIEFIYRFRNENKFNIVYWPEI